VFGTLLKEVQLRGARAGISNFEIRNSKLMSAQMGLFQQRDC
jgi:hypothetical protein